MTAVACPSCNAPIVFDERAIKSDDVALVESCASCGEQADIQRRAIAYEYTATKD